jgi:hypothetical protein
MITAQHDTTTPAIAVQNRTRAATMPRIKLTSRGFAIDHPDREEGERLMAEALGVADRDAMHGILRQLVRASVRGTRPDKTSLAFMLTMVKSIAPRDAIEAMLVAQMVSVHVMAMRCAHQLACADDIAWQESATRALARLARTFPAQIEALNRYRNKDEAAITVQNLSVQDGGKAIVGNVTQHARVMVAEPASANAPTKTDTPQAVRA